MRGRAGTTHDQNRPLYARALRLRHLNPGGILCFALLEGTVTLGALLALAELVPWWGVLALPGSVAVMVKINDMIAGAVGRSTPAGHGPTSRSQAGPAGWVAADRPVPGQPGAPYPPPGDESTTLGLTHSLNALQVGETADSPLQRARQSATRRYE